jgi:hypothetical protein
MLEALGSIANTQKKKKPEIGFTEPEDHIFSSCLE